MTTTTPGLSAIVLAAGQGTRMKSQLPKVLHPLCGRPLVDYPVAAAFEAGADQVVVVTSGHQELVDWNTLDVQARLEPGMSLQVFVTKNADLSKVLHVPEAHAKILVAGSPEFCDYFEGQNGKKRLVIAAHDGDTLTSIGKRYAMTVGQMERVNRRGRTDHFAAGERIIVYTERGKLAPGDVLVTSSN